MGHRSTNYYIRIIPCTGTYFELCFDLIINISFNNKRCHDIANMLNAINNN